MGEYRDHIEKEDEMRRWIEDEASRRGLGNCYQPSPLELKEWERQAGREPS